MKLGTEVGIGPGHAVLDGEPAPPPKGAQQPPRAHVCCGQTAGWIKMPLGRDVNLGPGDIVLDPAPPKGTQPRPQFSAHVCCGQMVAHLSYC